MTRTPPLPETPAPAATQPSDAEAHAHAQADDDAGGSWSALNDDELRTIERRRQQDGREPKTVTPDKS